MLICLFSCISAFSQEALTSEKSVEKKFYLPKPEHKTNQENSYYVDFEQDTTPKEILKDETADLEAIGTILQILFLPALIYSDYVNPTQAEIRQSNAPIDRYRRDYDALSH